jgi:hypothetical protein
MHGALSNIRSLICCVTFEAYTSVDKVLWVVTPCQLVNTDIFEELAAPPSGSIPEDFSLCLLCDLPVATAFVST